VLTGSVAANEGCAYRVLWCADARHARLESIKSRSLFAAIFGPSSYVPRRDQGTCPSNPPQSSRWTLNPETGPDDQ